MEAGLPVDLERGYKILVKVIEEHGIDFSQHFDKMLEKLGLVWSSRIVAAGITAYHDTKFGYLKPYPDTIPTLLRLRDGGILLGVVTAGKATKQWEKLIRLGIQHFFHNVTMCEELGLKELTPKAFGAALESLGVEAEGAIYVADRLEGKVEVANNVGLNTVKILRGQFKGEEASRREMKPRYEITRLSELVEILKLGKAAAPQPS